MSPSCTRSRSTCATEPTPRSLPRATTRSRLRNSLQRRTRHAVGGIPSVGGRHGIRRAEDRSTVTCGATRSLRRRGSAVEGAWTASTGQRRPSPRRYGKTRPIDPSKPVLLPLPLPLPPPLVVSVLTPDPKAPTWHRGARPTRVVPSLGATHASRERHRLSCRLSRAVIRPPTRSPRPATSLKFPSRRRTRSGRE